MNIRARVSTDGQMMATAGAALFAAAGLLTAVALILPRGPGPDPVADSITATLALICAGLLWRYGRRAPIWFFHVMVQVGNLMIAAGMLTGGPIESTEQYALLYLWGTLYAFYFFTQRAAILHSLAGASGYALVLAFKEPDLLWISKWFVMMSSFLVVGLMVCRLTDRIKTLARYDPLTGLKNRRTFEEELEHELSRLRGDPLLWVVLMDLDDFKGVNDTLGHQAGDRFLKEVAAAWSDHVRDSDLLARYGGDEFAGIFRDCSAENAEALAERLRSVVPDSKTCSIGVAKWDGLEESGELLRRADKALYDAKARGRDRVSIAV